MATKYQKPTRASKKLGVTACLVLALGLAGCQTSSRDQVSNTDMVTTANYQDASALGRIPAPVRKVPSNSEGASGYYGGYQNQQLDQRNARNLPPPPVLATRAQYPDWLLDGPEARGFAYYLAEGYRFLAKDEDNQHDFDNSARFLARAGAVERGENIPPEPLQNRILPTYAVDDLLFARQRLTSALGRGAGDRFPKIAARAQVMFDCWMEQQEENIQPDDVAQCRKAFEENMVRLEGKETPSASRSAQLSSNCTNSSCGGNADCSLCNTSNLIYFDLNKSDLTQSSLSTIQSLAQSLKSQGVSGLVVTGHTDRSGSDSYNMALSRRRLDAVVNALIAAGAPGENIAKALYYGESQPKVQTPDGQRLAENRRVEIRNVCGEIGVSPRQAFCSNSKPPLEGAANEAKRTK